MARSTEAKTQPTAASVADFIAAVLQQLINECAAAISAQRIPAQCRP